MESITAESKGLSRAFAGHLNRLILRTRPTYVSSTKRSLTEKDIASTRCEEPKKKYSDSNAEVASKQSKKLTHKNVFDEGDRT